MLGKIFYSIASKIFFIVLAVGLFLIGRATLKEVDRSNRVKEEVALLVSEAQKVQSDNSMLEERIRYFQTDDFQEQEAKQKLNYQSPNEQVVVIKPTVLGDSDQQEDSTSENTSSFDVDSLVPNYQKWKKHFFGF